MGVLDACIVTVFKDVADAVFEIVVVRVDVGDFRGVQVGKEVGV